MSRADHLCQQLTGCLVLLCVVLLSGCSSTIALHQARLQYQQGDAAAAIETLSSTEVVDAKDRLLYWLEKGLILHDSGDYENSTKELLAASRYLTQNDYLSLRDEGRALLANDWAGSYSGEYSEQLWVHSYLMMNFLITSQYDSAAVEARQALRLIDNHPEVLQSDVFTRALIGLSFEAAGQLNDSYIVNRKLSDALHKEQPESYNGIDHLLLAQAQRLGFTNDVREITQRINTAASESASHSLTKNNEAIVFISSGRIPHKVSGSIIADDYARLSFPQYYVNSVSAPRLEIHVNGASCDCHPISSDLGILVSESLNKRGVATATRTLIRAVAKEAVAEAISEKDEFAGGLARALFFALEEADTRSWQSLPRFITMLRVPLPADNDNVKIKIRDLEASQSDTQAIVVDLVESGPIISVRLP